MKSLLLAFFLSLPICLSAQYKLRKKQEGIAKTLKPIDYSIYKKHVNGELVLDGGFATVSRGLGILFYVRGEYFINDKISSRLNFFINSFKPNPIPQSYLQIAADGCYHFYQEKRFDVYAYLGFGVHRFRAASNLGGFVNNVTPTINSGVGGRYRVTPTFGLQLELGRTSTLGIYKSLDILKGE